MSTTKFDNHPVFNASPHLRPLAPFSENIQFNLSGPLGGYLFEAVKRQNERTEKWKKDVCKYYNLTESQFKGNEIYEGDLDIGDIYLGPFLYSFTGINFNLTGNLTLSYLSCLTSSITFKVGGNLDLSSLDEDSVKWIYELDIKGDLLLNSITSLPPDINIKVGGKIFLKKSIIKIKY